MLDVLKEKLGQVEGEIETARTADIEPTIRAKVEAYEAKVRQECEAERSKKVEKLVCVKIGIEYLIDKEAQKVAEERAAAELASNAETTGAATATEEATNLEEG